MIQTGQQIRDYKILSKIGEGGMGEVFLAEDVNLLRRVAIKVLAPELTRNPELINRFTREARLQASLIHPNIVTLFSFFEEQSTFMMVQEFAEGITLKKLIKTEIKLDEQTATEIVKQILEGLGFAHQRGIVHRDIKPSNIMVDGDNNIKIMDFGIAKILGDQGRTRTAKMGTVHYMSPEQVRAQKDIDQRTDIYSLGITFFEMLTGELPFNTKTDSDYEIMEEIVHGIITDPLKLKGRISDKLIAIIKKMTEKEKTNRYATCYQCKIDIVGGEEVVNETQIIKNDKQETKPRYKKILQEELIPGSIQNGKKKTIRKKHKIRKKILITMLILVLLYIPSYFIYENMLEWGYFGYENAYDEWEDNSLIPIKKPPFLGVVKFGYRYSWGEVALPMKYDFAGYLNEGIARVSKDNKWGYIDQLGNVAIPFDYKYAENFSGGLAIVNKSDKYGMINKYNSTVVPFEYDYMSIGSFRIPEKFIYVRKDDKRGLLYKNGQICLPAEYDDIIVYSNGISVLKDGEWGWSEFDQNNLIHPYFGYTLKIHNQSDTLTIHIQSDTLIHRIMHKAKVEKRSHSAKIEDRSFK